MSSDIIKSGWKTNSRRRIWEKATRLEKTPRNYQHLHPGQNIATVTVCVMLHVHNKQWTMAWLPPLKKHTSMLKGRGGTVGSRENMWSQSRACIHKTRLSTSLAMGPGDDSTKKKRNSDKMQQMTQRHHDDALLSTCWWFLPDFCPR